MSQWINIIWNNSFVNPTQLSSFCENFGAIHLVQPGLMAGRWASRQTGGQAGWQVGMQMVGLASEQAGGQNACNFWNFSLCLTKQEHYYSSMKAFRLVFQQKPVLKQLKNLETDRPQLLSTNDTYIRGSMIHHFIHK